MSIIMITMSPIMKTLEPAIMIVYISAKYNG